jgi:hypothetical protein
MQAPLTPFVYPDFTQKLVSPACPPWRMPVLSLATPVG